MSWDRIGKEDGGGDSKRESRGEENTRGVIGGWGECGGEDMAEGGWGKGVLIAESSKEKRGEGWEG